jgi:UDP-glucose 4-epimerase
MASIDVSEIDNEHFEVVVVAKTTTSHRVSVQANYADKLAQGKVSNAELVKKSFEFLLERETNTSILRQFDLSVIANYFPEYESSITKA